MSAPGSHLAESLKLLRELAAEADALQQAAGGSVTAEAPPKIGKQLDPS